MLVVNPPIFLVDKKVISNYNFVASLTLRFKDRCFPVNFVKFLTLVVRSILRYGNNMDGLFLQEKICNSMARL